MSSGQYALDKSTQSVAQQLSKSPLNGYRKPTHDGGNQWCNCRIPVLVSAFNGRGSAWCLRCSCSWYN